MGRKIRAVLLSMMVVCLCLALLVCATYALFSDLVTVNNHLQAGSLKLGLERVSYQTCTLADNGLLETSEEDTTVVDLTADASSLFEIEEAAPFSWYEADIRVSNNGNVAFDYGVRMLWNSDGSATESQKELASQITITVTYGGEQVAQFPLNAGWDVNLGAILAGGDAQVFTLRAAFADDVDNNLVQQISLEFDMQVFAVQKTN